MRRVKESAIVRIQRLNNTFSTLSKLFISIISDVITKKNKIRLKYKNTIKYIYTYSAVKYKTVNTGKRSYKATYT